MKLNYKYILELRRNTIGRYGKKMTRAELAFRLEMDACTIYRMETEPKFNPGVLTIAKIAKYFNVAIDDLLICD